MSKRADILPILDAALAGLPASMDSPQARVLLIAIALQESRLTHRDQIVKGKKPGVKGPALGLWQFELGGGVKGVLSHPASALHAKSLVPSGTNRDVWLALETDDVLAARLARLLLWTDPRPLPVRGDAAAGWNYYIRNWRPGKPHPQTWGAFWREAEALVYAPT
jgi:hypothetical protein